MHPVPYGGVATRGLALAVDALLANLLFLAAGAMVGLVASLVGKLRPEWLVDTLVGAGWLVVVVGYFVGFWSSAGQTPGLRLMQLRVVGPATGAGAVLVDGEPEREHARVARRAGVPHLPKVWDVVDELATELGIAPLERV